MAGQIFARYNKEGADPIVSGRTFEVRVGTPIVCLATFLDPYWINYSMDESRLRLILTLMFVLNGIG